MRIFSIYPHMASWKYMPPASEELTLMPFLLSTHHHDILRHFFHNQQNECPINQSINPSIHPSINRSSRSTVDAWIEANLVARPTSITIERLTKKSELTANDLALAKRAAAEASMRLAHGGGR
jgi:hypothetical protein